MTALVGRIAEAWDPAEHPRGEGGHFIDALGRIAAGESEGDVRKDLERTLYAAPHGAVFDVNGIRVEKNVKEGKPFKPGAPPPQNHLVKHPGNTHRASGEFPSVATGAILDLAKEKAAKDAAPPEEPKKAGKRTLSHRLPDGTIETRQSQHDYTHVVTTTGTEVPFNDFWKRSAGRRRVVSWHRSKAAADKAAAGKSGEGYRAVKVEEVNGG